MPPPFFNPTFMWNFLYWYIAIVSVITIPNVGEPFWFPKEAAYSILGFCFIALSLMQSSQKREYYNKWLGFILMYAIISFGFFFYTPLIFNKPDGKVLWNLWNYCPTLNLILGIFLIFTLVRNSTIEIWVKIAKFLCWIGFIFSCYGILQFCGIDQLFRYNSHWIYQADIRNPTWFQPHLMITFFGNSMHTANFIACLSPLCLMFKDLRYKIFYAVMLLAICLTQSAISLVAFGIGFICYFLLLRRYKIALLLISTCILGGICLLFLKPNFWCFSSRIELWKEVLIKTIRLAPWTGFGLGSFAAIKYVTKSVGGAVANSAEFELIQMFHDGGLIFITLVIGYFCNLIKRLLYAEKSIILLGWVLALISYFIVSCGSFPLRVAPLALIGILIISAIENQI